MQNLEVRGWAEIIDWREGLTTARLHTEETPIRQDDLEMVNFRSFTSSIRRVESQLWVSDVSDIINVLQRYFGISN